MGASVGLSAAQRHKMISNEVVQLDDGRLMLNMRNYDRNPRAAPFLQR